ncbi:TPA: hypothetical protein EYP70_06390 [Candidatus Bathyarchaeota archaeon]|nr:hypothetical protein [Candidatus Bathyarchaeota archaeon]
MEDLITEASLSLRQHDCPTLSLQGNRDGRQHLIERLEPAIKFYTLYRVPTKPKLEPVSSNGLITAYKLTFASKSGVGRELYLSTFFQIS